MHPIRLAGLWLVPSGLFLCALLLSANAMAAKPPVVLTNVPAGTGTGPPDPSIKIYKYRNKSGVRSFSDRAPMGARYEVVQYFCFACNVESKLDWNSIPLHLHEFASPIAAASSKYRVDPALVRAVIHAESAFRPRVRSSMGALGLMQLMPDTAQEMGVVNALSPSENIHGGVRYLAMMLQQHGGDITLATAAYNAGPGAVKRHQGVPPYEETQTYVKRVRILHQRYRKATLSVASS